MSPSDDALDEMTNFLRRRRPTRFDSDVVALLSGATPAGNPELAGAAALTSALRALGDDVPAPTPALAALLREGFVPAAAAFAPVLAPRRRPVLVRVAGLSIAAKVLLGSSAAFAGVAAAATGGVLPDAVTDRFSQIVDVFAPGNDNAPAQLPDVVPAAPTPVPRDDTTPTGPPPVAPVPQIPSDTTPREPSAVPSQRPTPAPVDQGGALEDASPEQSQKTAPSAAPSATPSVPPTGDPRSGQSAGTATAPTPTAVSGRA